MSGFYDFEASLGELHPLSLKRLCLLLCATALLRADEIWYESQDSTMHGDKVTVCEHHNIEELEFVPSQCIHGYGCGNSNTTQWSEPYTITRIKHVKKDKLLDLRTALDIGIRYDNNAIMMEALNKLKNLNEKVDIGPIIERLCRDIEHNNEQIEQSFEEKIKLEKKPLPWKSSLGSGACVAILSAIWCNFFSPRVFSGQEKLAYGLLVVLGSAAASFLLSRMTNSSAINSKSWEIEYANDKNKKLVNRLQLLFSSFTCFINDPQKVSHVLTHVLKAPGRRRLSNHAYSIIQNCVTKIESVTLIKAKGSLC